MVVRPFEFRRKRPFFHACGVPKTTFGAHRRSTYKRVRVIKSKDKGEMTHGLNLNYSRMI